ncbi:FISUMP domain-containing protein [Plebeiibacterium sediminum]|uniref:Fibrobacter succinogenes major paralogous domain-containing protein n=1 Tax=Plebeiibacterium sediminum TaxID=2992112 RepID=A0AAE3M3L3_9BACT|nr:FISUMP domain-containing protein [Plebeiobacterium sediminum]MCW3786234.1 fibrobacter succinogenes major paralogous domain-containing protein [Plebeiobacterium sediminum]
MFKNLILALLVIFSVSSCSDDPTEEKEPLTIGSLVDVDGNVYETIVIGNQTWMAENLRVTKYSDGTEIPLVVENNAWGDLQDGNVDKAYCFYDNDEEEYGGDYGALYTYAAAMNGAPLIEVNTQGVCPDGWHIPSESEWHELFDYVGGVVTAGGYLKETGTSHWKKTESDVTNEYYFNALPGGSRYLYDGTFDRITSVGYWWSSSENTEYDAYAVSLSNSTLGVYTSLYGKSYGFSVRCVED